MASAAARLRCCSCCCFGADYSLHVGMVKKAPPHYIDDHKLSSDSILFSNIAYPMGDVRRSQRDTVGRNATIEIDYCPAHRSVASDLRFEISGFGADIYLYQPVRNYSCFCDISFVSAATCLGTIWSLNQD